MIRIDLLGSYVFFSDLNSFIHLTAHADEEGKDKNLLACNRKEVDFLLKPDIMILKSFAFLTARTNFIKIAVLPWLF